MTNRELFMTAWEFEPSVVIGTLGLLVAYLVAVRGRFDRRTWLFLTGLGIMFLALVSPLDPLGDDYLFSAHMAQHLMLDFMAPVLFVLGLPPALLERWMRIPLFDRAERILGHPVLTWLLAVFTLWAWHLPGLYNETLESEEVHILEHMSFLITGTMLWWPVFTPLGRRRMAPMIAIVYCAGAAVFNAILGIIFTTSNTAFYDGYADPEDELGALSLVRETWGLNQLDDQKLGGALMWVGGSIIFVWAIMALVARWYRTPENTQNPLEEGAS